MLKLIEKRNVSPLCPHCERDVDELWYQELRATFGRRYVYFCSKCNKIVGVSHRKGFFMG